MTTSSTSAAPSEYAEDHIPGAINLPALSNEERAEVGTIYKQDSAFDARKIGAALVARNAADHIDGPLARSGRRLAAAGLLLARRAAVGIASPSILSQIGWRAETIEGRLPDLSPSGACRRSTVDPAAAPADPARRLHRHRQDRPPHLLAERGRAGDRPRGAGRAPRLAAGRHARAGSRRRRGSRARWREAFTRARPARPFCRGRKQQGRPPVLPPSLWAAMKAAPRIEIVGPRAARATFLARTYADLSADRERLESA